MSGQKPDAAALGRGRTLMVISRMARPRRNPLRVKSASNCSPMTFCTP
jgi:hypothetical protein